MNRQFEVHSSLGGVYAITRLYESNNSISSIRQIRSTESYSQWLLELLNSELSDKFTDFTMMFFFSISEHFF